jgi:hypothetical protein
MLRQNFHPCEAGFITGTCKGRCCEGGQGGIKVAVHISEEDKVRSRGATVVGGYIQPDNRGLCPFKTQEGFCGIHGTDAKPFGCCASPFTLNDNDTLIVRNRYRLLKCYNCEGSLPAYEAHRWSLEQIFGVVEAERIANCAKAFTDQIDATVGLREYTILKDNDDLKHGRNTPRKKPALEWIAGDAMDCLFEAPEADLIFSCPPYGDLEVYSDDPQDLSTMDYPTFMSVYSRIILRCANKLRRGGFACFVVGDFRDRKSGYYRGFVADTITAWRVAGLELYNDAVLLTAIGSLPIRVSAQFDKSRKLGKTHQNVLVFKKP